MEGKLVDLNIHNSYTYFSSDISKAKEVIRDALTYEIKNTYGLKMQLEKKYRGNKSKVFQELNKLKYKNFIENQSFFLTGFLERVCKALDDNNISYRINDLRDNKPVKLQDDLVLNGIEPYWYQEQIIHDLVEKKRVILAVATGGGKTISAIIATNALNKKTLFITHKLDLLYQTYENYREYTNKRIGIIGDGRFEEGEVTIGTTGTLYNIIKKDPEYALEFFAQYDFLIVDEAHRVSSKSFNTIAKYCVNAEYRLGLTATPFMKTQEEDMLLEGAISQYQLEVTPKQLIDLGILAQPYFFYIPVEGEIYKTEWDEIYHNGIVEYEPRNEAVIKIALERAAKNDKILIVVLHLNHGEILYNKLKDTNCRTSWVNGSDKTSVRRKVLNEISNDKIDCIIATNIFDEGIDITSINCVILAAGTKSAPALFQRAGRSMRRKANNKCLIIDFIDYQHKILLNHSVKRYENIKNKDGYDIIDSLKKYDER